MKNLYVTPNLARKVMSDLGYTNPKSMSPSSCIVNSVEKDNEKLITKMGRFDYRIGNWMAENLMKEKKLLERFSGYEKVSQIKGFYDFSQLAKPMKDLSGNVFINPFLLEKEFVKGEQLKQGYLTSQEQSQIEDMVRYMHRQGHANLDINARNFVRSKDRGIIAIDICGDSRLDHLSFKQKMIKDLSDLERL